MLYIQRAQSTLIYPSPLASSLKESKFNVSQERKVEIRREKPGGLGLSVKGGAEHNLPILISRIFKDQAADKTGQLFVGDAILQVNGIHVDTFTHDEAVTVLKNAGDLVVLIVRHYQSASSILTHRDKDKTESSSRDVDNNNHTKMTETGRESNGNYPTLTKRTTLLSIPLLCASVSRFNLSTGQLSEESLEIRSLDGSLVAELSFDDSRCCEDWFQLVYRNVLAQNSLSIILTNKQLLPHDRVMHMCWLCERVTNSKSTNTQSTNADQPIKSLQSNQSSNNNPSQNGSQLTQAVNQSLGKSNGQSTVHPADSTGEAKESWRRLFLSVKGSDVSFYDTPPVKTRDWVKCEKSMKIYECIFKTNKSRVTDSYPGTLNSFQLECVDGAVLTFNVETYEELVKLEKSWYKSTYYSIKHQRSMTFGCTSEGRLCGLTLDFSEGFCLYESQSKACLWSYRFSQLRESSDDDESSLKLMFLNTTTGLTETRELVTTELRRLLYGIHAFLSAKLASVDPIYLINME